MDKKFKRIFVVVIDSLGVGALPDAAEYGDVGTDTLGHIAERTEGFKIPENGTLAVTKETFNGTAVTAETVTAEGKTATFYFDNSGNLVGTKSVADGTTSVSKISNFSTNVADSLFEIPNGYIYMDMSWLM